MPITAFYAALLVPLYLYLALRVIIARRSGRVEIGDGGNRELLRRMRVHANFAEYVPLALVVMALAESLSAPVWLMHAGGLLLATGRYVHAYGLSREPHILRLRVAGMMLTFASLGLLAAMCLALSLPRIV